MHEMLTKLWNKTEFYVVAYFHQGCHRTSNAVDRAMNRLCRLMYETGTSTVIKARPSYGWGLGLAVELSPLRPSEQPTPHPRQSRPSTQRQTLS